MELNQSNNQNLPNEDSVAELLTLECKVDKSGTKRYYNKEGKRHRIHGPAVIYKDGSEYWYKNGESHREDGPAIMWKDGEGWFYINDKRLTEKQFLQWQKDNGIKPIK